MFVLKSPDIHSQTSLDSRVFFSTGPKTTYICYLTLCFERNMQLPINIKRYRLSRAEVNYSARCLLYLEERPISMFEVL